MATHKDPSSALILFSGGQDSSICLAWALERFDHVETIGFYYGQRHHVEMEARKTVRATIGHTFPVWGKKLGADHLIDLAALGSISETAMTRDTQITTSQSGLPNTFVPGRNLMFLVMAGALAWRRAVGVLVGGMCETDFSGYPDCRQDTLDAQMRAINLGMETNLLLETPLMQLTKAESWALAYQLGGAPFVEIVRIHSHTCYMGERNQLHDWGYGCGDCPACDLRANGWAGYCATLTEPDLSSSRPGR